jgi:serine beta-lactamase-like protein LACTB
MKALRTLVCFIVIAAASQAAELPQATAERISALCAKFMEKEQVPGLSVAVGLGEEIVFEKGYGFADLENKVPATARTRFRTASIAKSLTAVIALRLADEGKLQLDAPVQQYVPEFPKKLWPITSRQMLGHLSGIRHYAWPGEAAGKEHFNSIRGALPIFAHDILLHEPGTKYLYSSYGYNLLGAVAESAGGANFAMLLERIVTKPAGMPSTCVDEQWRIIPDRARGYALRDGVLSNCELHDTSMKIPGGGLLSTSADLVRFMQAANSGKLLKPETVKLMWTRQRTKSGEQTSYGLGWLISPDDSPMRTVGHSGGQAGTTTLMKLQPDTGRAVAVMCNREKAPIPPLVELILQELEKLP